MKKLTLNLDDLQVKSFDTTPEPSRTRGTVEANQDDSVYYCPSVSCPTVYDRSCNGTCDQATCGPQVCIPLPSANC